MWFLLQYAYTNQPNYEWFRPVAQASDPMIDSVVHLVPNFKNHTGGKTKEYNKGELRYDMTLALQFTKEKQQQREQNNKKYDYEKSSQNKHERANCYKILIKFSTCRKNPHLD